jgi:uncharacterized RDD family membrane protein YckC
MTSWDDTEPSAWDETPAAAEPRYAGFWIRVVAVILDGIIISIPLPILFLAIGNSDSAASQGIRLVISALYTIILWVRWGRTIGGRILGLRLVRVDGEPVTYGTAVVRYLMVIVSAIAMFIGLIWVGFDKRKQGWMDKAAGTYVIRD